MSFFCERARAVQPSFALTDENAPDIAAICQRLDGLPLAIELAAPRLRMFSPQQLLNRLEDPFAVLSEGPRDAPDRQRTLRDTIAWSYDLLNESQRALFRALCVCRGGWTLEAAEAIAPIYDSAVTVLSDLNSLVEQNLVRSMTDPDGSLRFGMLETVQEFGMTQSAALGDATDLSERHAHYYVSWAARQSEHFVYADAKQTIRALSSDLENLRTAYRWVLAQESSNASMVELLVVANAGLRLFWRAMGLLVEGRRWIERGLATPGASESIRCVGLIGIGWIATEQGDLAEAQASLEEALTIAEENEYEEATLDCIYCLARIALWQADYMQAIEIHEQGIALARRRGDEKSVRMFLANLGLVVAIAGDLGRGKQMLTDVLEMERESSGCVSPIVIMDLASIACMEGEFNNARDLISQALSMERESGPSRVVANCFEVCAPLAVLESQYARAAYLYGAANALRLKTGAPVKPHDQHFYYDGYVGRGRAALGLLAWDDAWEAGRALSFDEAVDYALAFDDEPNRSGAPVVALLSKREIEVLSLLVKGRTNQEIAAELYISPHTAANHVAHILNKLEVDTRTAAATWAVREGVV